ncbi:MAG: hypothetical protein HOD90_01540 [Nitrospina sp.]|jgi:hypothetical protein|nr:hypothetical protein [Nitrospina sp.]
MVVGVKHEELYQDLREGDLIIWGCMNKEMKIPSGVILHKLENTLDIQTGEFKIIGA